MSKKEDLTILVVGATGRQGRAVARQFSMAGWKVRAMTRNTTGPKAMALRSLGVELVEADLDDKSSLAKALDGTYGVFAAITPFEKGVEAEARQGQNLVEAAKLASVSHFVYSSVGGADRNTGIPHFESKWAIENHLRSSKIPYTVLRPASFMENFSYPYNKKSILSGRLESTLGPETPLQMIAVDDIGGFAALAFDAPDQWVSREIEIAGDQKTMPEVAELFSKSIGSQVSYVRTSLDSVPNPDLRAMQEWFQREGYRADIEELKKIRPELMDLKEWLKRSGWDRSGQA
jgi:uncharacterized protein YbjT (DUF2867 family)